VVTRDQALLGIHAPIQHDIAPLVNHGPDTGPVSNGR